MELKVRVDGILRVVCGVTESSTCQDIVIALAHAMGKTGRFTLVEKWRDNERPLLPKDCPVQTLQKWGEYANEVQFLLKHPEGTNSDKPVQKVKEKPKDGFTHHNFTPPVGKDVNVKRSLTFSGAHHGKSELSTLRKAQLSQTNLNKVHSFDENHHTVSSAHTALHKKQPMQPQTLQPNYPSASSTHNHCQNSSSAYHNNHVHEKAFQPYHKSGVKPCEVPTGRRISPFLDSVDSHVNSNHFTKQHKGPNNENQHNLSLPQRGTDSPQGDNRDVGPSSSSEELTNTQLQHRTHHRRVMPVSNHENVTQNQKPFHQKGAHGNSVSILPLVQNRTRPSAFQPVVPQKQKSDSVDLTQNPSQQPQQLSGHNDMVPGYNNYPVGIDIEEYDLDSNFPDILRNSRKDVFIEEYRMPEEGGGGVVRRKEEPDPHIVKMQRLVSMQQERIRMQESQLQLIDTELASLEDEDRQRIDQQHSIGEETGQLQQQYNQNEAELVQLDTVKWVDVVDVEKSKEKNYHKDISHLKVKLETCIKELEENETKVSEIIKIISVEQKELQEMEEQQAQEKILAEESIADVQKNLESNTKEFELQTNSLSQVEEEIKKLDEKKEAKSKEIESLEKEITEVNLETLDTVPDPKSGKSGKAVLQVLEGRMSPALGLGRKFVTSPLNKILTGSKNPNGVWV